MPRPGYRWRHLSIGTKSSWLPGDPRGWRSRDHRRHSSGDYKQSPPVGEHEGLHDYCEDHSADHVVIPKDVRPLLGRALIEQFQKRQLRIVAVAISKCHAHVLVELIDNISEVKRIVGQCKGAASFAVRDVMPGAIWAEGAGYKPVDDPGHQANVHDFCCMTKGRARGRGRFEMGIWKACSEGFDQKKPGHEGPA